VGLGARAVEIADDRGHAGLVAHGGGQVDGLLGVILREAVMILAVSSGTAVFQVDRILVQMRISLTT
jgi:hypothetical protein